MTKQNEEIFLDALDKYKDRLFRLCMSYSTDQHIAKDLLQEALLAIWKSLESFKGNASIGTWMYRITINVCLRTQSIEKTARANHSTAIIIDEIPNENKDLDHAEDLRDLQKCIHQLHDADKALITLYLEELAYKDIAEITGLTENHIAVKIKRIKAKLLEMMEKRI